MKEITTIRISKELVNELSLLKVHPRESYNDVIVRLFTSQKTPPQTPPLNP